MEKDKPEVTEEGQKEAPKKTSDDTGKEADQVEGKLEEDVPEATVEPKPEEENQDVDKVLEGLAELKLGAEASEEVKQLLILLDFNGTLVFRDKKNLFPKIKGHFFATRTRYTIRPFARELVAHLLNDSRCKVAIYTSITKRNMMPVMYEFDKYFTEMVRDGKFDPIQVGDGEISTHSSIVDSSFYVFDQPYNARDPDGEDEWDTKRDLQKIWTVSKVKDAGFDATNTILVDAERRKVRDWTKNSIVVKEFDNILAMESQNGKPDNELKHLLEYLKDTVMTQMQQGKTVSEIIEKTPYTINPAK